MEKGGPTPSIEGLTKGLDRGGVDSIVRAGATAISIGEIERDDEGKWIAKTEKGQDFIDKYREALHREADLEFQKAEGEKPQVGVEPAVSVESPQLADIEVIPGDEPKTDPTKNLPEIKERMDQREELRAEPEETAIPKVEAEKVPEEPEQKVSAPETKDGSAVVEKVEEEPESLKAEKSENTKEVLTNEQIVEEIVRNTAVGKALEQYIAANRHEMPAEPFRKAENIGQAMQRFCRRVYLGIAKPEMYKAESEKKIVYLEGQRNIAEAEKQMKLWTKEESLLVAETNKAQTAIASEFMPKIADGSMTKKDWAKLDKITSQLVSHRFIIDSITIGRVAEKIGITDYTAPERKSWEGLKLGKDFDSQEKAKKQEIVSEIEAKQKDGETEKAYSLKEIILLKDETARKIFDTNPDLAKRFLTDQAGAVLRDLSVAEVIGKLTEEEFARTLDNPRIAENPQIMLDIISAMRGTKFECQRQEKRLDETMNQYVKMDLYNGYGQRMLTGIKKEFGRRLFDVDPDFDVKYNTRLNEIILNGHNALATGAAKTWQTVELAKLATNRTSVFAQDLRRGYNDLFAKLIPESKAIEKSFEASEKIVDLEVKKDEISSVLRFIHETRKQAGERKISFDKRMDELMAEAEDAYRDQEEARETEKRIKTEEILEQMVDMIAPNKARKEEIMTRFRTEGLSEGLVDQLIYTGQIIKLRMGTRIKALEEQVEHAKANRELINSQAKKGAVRVEDHSVGISEKEYEQMEKSLNDLVVAARDKTDSVCRDVEDQIVGLNDLVSKNVMAKLRKIME